MLTRIQTLYRHSLSRLRWPKCPIPTIGLAVHYLNKSTWRQIILNPTIKRRDRVLVFYFFVIKWFLFFIFYNRSKNTKKKPQRQTYLHLPQSPFISFKTLSRISLLITHIFLVPTNNYSLSSQVESGLDCSYCPYFCLFFHPIFFTHPSWLLGSLSSFPFRKLERIEFGCESSPIIDFDPRQLLSK